MRETILGGGGDAKARAGLRQALDGAGYMAAEAADGNDALAVPRFMRFDLLITDMDAPVLDALRSELSATRVMRRAGLPQPCENEKRLDTVRAALAS